MKTLKYNIIDDESILISEEITDKNGNIIKFTNYESEPCVVKLFSYNEEELLVEETEISENEELSKTCFIYNDKKECTESLLYIGGELYEKVITDFREDGFTRITFQDGEETEKMVKEINGKNYVNKFYENKEIVQSQKATFDTYNNAIEIKIMDSDDQLITLQKEKFDNSENIIHSQEFTPEGHLLAESIYEYNGDKIIREVNRNFSLGSSEVIEVYEYDGDFNMVKHEARTPEGRVLMYHQLNYDNNRRIVEEAYVSSGEPGAIYGGGLRGNSYHYIYEYEDNVTE
ncbi:MAG: hypothetical protein CVU05_06115 [Bacteroidetes bacterium HGW-Bacteroidetes-21]|jgi:hypothetical protein|nr:MAG: hypothetical protein CVU05_06115 [Bacteroidetes bacterium HGW-Bacteroidetes-21]